MDRSIAMMLEKEPWVVTSTDASVALLRAIKEAQRPLLLRHEAKVAELVRAMQGSVWYRDGLDESELLAAAGVFTKSRDLGLTLRPESTGESDQLEGLDWTPLLQEVLRSGLFSTHVSQTGAMLSVLTTSTDGLDTESVDAQRIAGSYLDEITKLAGDFKSSSVLQVLVAEVTYEGRALCGQTFYELGITLIVRQCLTDRIVIHELTHHATPRSWAIWYEEGTASWVADYLVNPSRRRDAFEPTIDLPGPVFRENYQGGGINAQYLRDSAAGLAFYLDLERLIGAEALVDSIRKVREGADGSQVIAAILASTPAALKGSVTDLIISRCRTGQPDNLMPCVLSP